MRVRTYGHTLARTAEVCVRASYADKDACTRAIPFEAPLHIVFSPILYRNKYSHADIYRFPVMSLQVTDLFSRPFRENHIEIPSFITVLENQLCTWKLTQENVMVRVVEHFDDEVSETFCRDLYDLMRNSYYSMEKLLLDRHICPHNKLSSPVIHRCQENVNQLIKLGNDYCTLLRHIKFSSLPCLEEVATIYTCQDYEIQAVDISGIIYSQYKQLINLYATVIHLINALKNYLCS